MKDMKLSIARGHLPAAENGEGWLRLGPAQDKYSPVRAHKFSGEFKTFPVIVSDVSEDPSQEFPPLSDRGEVPLRFTGKIAMDGVLYLVEGIHFRSSNLHGLASLSLEATQGIIKTDTDGEISMQGESVEWGEVEVDPMSNAEAAEFQRESDAIIEATRPQPGQSDIRLG